MKYFCGVALERTSGEEEKLTRSRRQMCQVCIYHIGQDPIGTTQADCGEFLAVMA